MKKHISIFKKKGFTLIEIVISVALMSIILVPFAKLLEASSRTIEISDSVNYSDLHLLYSDISFDSSIASTITASSNKLEIERIDGCTIDYIYDSTTKILNKEFLCELNPDGTENNGLNRSLRIYDVQSFSVVDDSILTPTKSTYTINIRKIGDKLPHIYQIVKN
jgi:prepilin-type N-terminal cleavage/methylation domain-containing protein